MSVIFAVKSSDEKVVDPQIVRQVVCPLNETIDFAFDYAIFPDWLVEHKIFGSRTEMQVAPVII